MAKVKVLDKSTSEKIAAGEVVERPASVVKELVENSIDAGSRHIQINLEEGGQKLIEIMDDGMGMAEEDLKLAVLRFATSKIRDIDELDSIRTFGFRGEALPSIAAVSRMEIITREKDASHGYAISGEAGEFPDPAPVGCPPGTLISVKDLFFNLPARKKFMKSPSSETAWIISIAQKLALVNPEIAFRLKSNGRDMLDFPDTMGIKERILNIWGMPISSELIFIENETSSIRISGWICPPEKFKTQRSYQLFFANNRYIKSQLIGQAVQEGFSPLIPSGKFPLALVFADLVPGEMDVNVHPNKMEVRFANAGEVFRAVRDAIRKSLKGFGYSPVIPGFSENFGSGGSYRGGHSSSSHTGVQPYVQGQTQQDVSFFDNISDISIPAPPVVENKDLPGQTNLLDDAGFLPETEPSGGEHKSAGISDSGFQAFAQIRKTYIIGKFHEELWLVDQHTAHERINYEKLSRIGTGDYQSQKLLFPIVMDLPHTLFNFLKDKQNFFEELGFEIEPFGGSTFLIKAVPYGFRNLDRKETLMAVMEEAAEGEPYRNLTAFFEKLRSTIACKASVRAGDSLTLEEMNKLVNELVSMDYSNYCPHGRPVVVKISREHMDRMFHR
ncbi:MAG: DNA mismatch repair endonuclease MutL [Firmicutes bacterium]|nr:DNA mismatch repair endonuclease MutL [Bacillota bacterium]